MKSSCSLLISQLWSKRALSLEWSLLSWQTTESVCLVCVRLAAGENTWKSIVLMSRERPRLTSFKDDVTMKQVLLVRRLLTGYLHAGVQSLLESVGVCRMLGCCCVCCQRGRRKNLKPNERSAQARVVLEWRGVITEHAPRSQISAAAAKVAASRLCQHCAVTLLTQKRTTTAPQS